MSQKIDLSVSNEFSGVRIDKFLAENIDFLTRSMISKLIENGNVFVFDKIAQKISKIIRQR
jgi:ribosomal 50S subunit-recycling heat shock protein